MNRDPWKTHAARLAEQLAEQGAITDPAWRRTVEAVPRHVFVPGVALVLAYSDQTLVAQRKQHPDQPGFSWSTSSSTRPSFTLRLLHLLDVRDGVDVLEIGTGTGYTAALLCHRLDSQHVTTVDIDPDLTRAARRHLAHAGYRPNVTTGDGLHGDPAHAPYDRVLATVAHEHVPY
ncbi:methyltransferase domain-containing protein, partial [Actinomadura rubrobrunea]|uniref:methyltransferase domain-containing protein n=1 Tax=Actinomadura rubrobrunea TaxID=115335 RepID=UPI002553BF5C